MSPPILRRRPTPGRGIEVWSHPADDRGDGGPPPATALNAKEYPWPPTPDPGDRPHAQSATRPWHLDDLKKSSTSALAGLPEVLTARQVAAILRVGRNELYQAVARGDLRAVRIGRSIRIPKQALLALLAAASPPTASGDDSPRQPATQMRQGPPKGSRKCSGRCIRWYPRLELPRAPDGTRRFEALGGYPTRAQAEAALADALARRSHGFLLDPAKLTVDQYLDRWLDHVRTNRRARTVARYTALLRHHVRPAIGARSVKNVTPLEIQAIYDRLTISGRRDGKPGGLAPQHILAVHRCLHRALQQAVTWRLVAHNPAAHATPPPSPAPRRWP